MTTTIDSHAAHSARRITDPLARAAIVAKAEADAAWYAGILAGLTDTANANHTRVDQHLTFDLCRVEEILTDVAAQLAAGNIYAERVAA